MVLDDGLYELVDVALKLDLVTVGWDGEEGGPKTDGQVIRLHHVLVLELGEAATAHTIMFNCQ